MSWISSINRARAGVETPASPPSFGDDADLRIDLGAPLAHGEITIDARVRLGGATVEVGQRSETGARAGIGAGRRQEHARIEPLNPTGVTPRAAATAITSRPSGSNTMRRRGSAKFSDIEVAVECRGEQHRSVGQLAPQVAPDVVGEDRVGLEPASRACICRVRSRTEPSISPTTTAPRLPKRISPGASQSAPKLTKQPMVRSAPTARAMASSLRPFCADRT